MNRRGFLSSLITAAAGVTVAYSFPSIIVPQNIEPPLLFIPEGPVTYHVGMRGLPYIVNNTGDYFGLSRSVYECRGDILTPEMLEKTRVIMKRAIAATDHYYTQPSPFLKFG